MRAQHGFGAATSSVVVSFLLLALPVDTAHGERVLWLEAEQFDAAGGWVNDPQFIDQMGSPYLMANGRGTPVDDASTTLSVSTNGPYRLWVRSKDWIPEHHPGTLLVLLNGEPVNVTFGQSGRTGWQ